MPESRSTRRLRAIKAEYRLLRPQPCMRCGQPIDYDAESPDPDSFSLGHIVAWQHSRELREDRGNLRQEHLGCNRAAGVDRGDARQAGMASGLL